MRIAGYDWKNILEIVRLVITYEILLAKMQNKPSYLSTCTDINIVYFLGLDVNYHVSMYNIFTLSFTLWLFHVVDLYNFYDNISKNYRAKFDLESIYALI